ncbi:type I restriction-modification system DNA methylase subunit [Lewinella antarctica]|uniref:Type I restriction-modification system DNA methylase subunit n=1 Tax=Neolewinella antarctica TaxID=442734 RepID=A0ABX0X8U4_9BACT|nr:type I restriction-modification system DNA methylase subunit [Neolewinella antarctica]
MMANGSMSSQSSGEGDIRQRLVENDAVDCMIALPGQLFYTTQIPVCCWFLAKDRSGVGHPQAVDRRGKVLFIDARQMGSMIDRTHKELTEEDIATITETYHNWRNGLEAYADVAGYCRSADLAEIAKNDFVLTPGRYVGIPEEEDDGVPFEEKMGALTRVLSEQMKAGAALDLVIAENLKVLGYEV